MPKVLTNLDLNQNEIQNAVLHPLPSPPLNPVEGQIYYNSTDNLIYQWDGTKWLGENIKILNNAIENNGIGYIPETTNVVLPETTITDYFRMWPEEKHFIYQIPIKVGKNYKVTINNQIFNITAVEDYAQPCIKIENHTNYGNILIYGTNEYNSNPIYTGWIRTYGTPSTPLNSITISIELLNDIEPIYSQINKELLPYGEIISQAVELGGLGYAENYNTIVDSTTNWVYIEDNFWSCEFSSSLLYEQMNKIPIIIEYNNDIIKLNNSDNNYLDTGGTYFNSTLFPLGCWVNIFQNSYSKSIVFEIYLPSNIQNIGDVLGNFPIKIKITDGFRKTNPALTTVFWDNILNRPTAPIFYRSCTTNASTSIKNLGTIDNTRFYDGLSIRVCFYYACGNVVPQLNINNSTFSIYIRYGSSTSLAPGNCWLAGEVKDFVYYSGYWILINPTLLSDSVSDTSTRYAATANAVKTAYDLANTANTKYYLNTSVTFNATTHDATTSPSAVSYNNTANKSIDLGYYITASNSSNVSAVTGTTSTTTSSLTISLNGTSQGAWNGSSDKGINITPTAIGAAALASPGFTGVPTAPTAAVSSNSTQIATTAFVQAAIQAAIANAVNASY